MAMHRESLEALQSRIYDMYKSLFNPVDKSTRYNLMRVLATVEAGIYHQLLGDLDFLSEQLFPDTATGDYLRLHWSDRVPPLYAVAAIGKIKMTGTPTVSVPSGLVFTSANGKRYYTDKVSSIGQNREAIVWVKAEQAGEDSNLGSGEKLRISSALPVGLDSEAVTIEKGILGGINEETDSEYLSRVLVSLRNTTRYGKIGDFAAWAVDSSADVSKAFEIKNFGVFGSLLIQVISGNHIDSTVAQVGNLDVVSSYIETVAPPVLFTVRTPNLIPLNMTITLIATENSLENQGLAQERIKVYLNSSARPGVYYTEGSIKDVVIDGVKISYARIKFPVNQMGRYEFSVLEYPVLGTVQFEVQ